MFGRIIGVVIFTLFAALVSGIVGSIDHSKRTLERRKEITRLSRKKLDWDDIADILNKAGFRDEVGNKLTGEKVKEEYKIIAAEEALRERVTV